MRLGINSARAVRLRDGFRRQQRFVNDVSHELRTPLTIIRGYVDILERYEVTVKGQPVELTHKEYELLKYLVENKRNVLSRDQILQTVWGYDYIGDTNVVDVYISYLRSKIDDKFGEKYIYTTRGVGYAIRD